MKYRTTVAIVVLSVLGIGAWLAARDHEHDAQASAATRGGDASNTPGARIDALAATPQARAYRERKAFEDRIQRFLRHASDLGPVQRSEQAASLSASVDTYERDRQLSAGEAFLLQAALIKATASDQDEQIERLAQLAGRYRADTARREAAWLASQRQDPAFQSYKARERAVVAEIMAMTDIPDGLTRDQYLRQRLQQERERVYR